MAGLNTFRLGVALLVVGCSTHVPRLPAPEERVRVWPATTQERAEQEAVAGEVFSVRADTVEIRPGGGERLVRLPLDGVQALEIDVARENAGARLLSCGVGGLWSAAAVTGLREGDADEVRVAVSALAAAAFLKECIAPTPQWRAGRIPSRGRSPSSDPSIGTDR